MSAPTGGAGTPTEAGPRHRALGGTSDPSAGGQEARRARWATADAALSDPRRRGGLAEGPAEHGRADERRGAPAQDGAVPLPPEALDVLMPMHVLIDPGGRIARHGPLLGRLAGADGTPAAAEGHDRRGAPAPMPFAGADAFEVLTFRRRRGLGSVAALREAQGAPLHLALRADPRTPLTGVAVGLPDGGVLIDLSLGLGVVEAVRRHRLTATDFAPTSLAVEMLYLVEANTAVLSESRDLVDRLQGARVAAEVEAQTDTLTGLRNRRALDQVLAGLLRQEGAFALMAIDLDRFKQINDTMGHAAGDHVLREAASVMLRAVRAGDVVARAGGDEFVILFPGLVRIERLAEIADRLIEGLERPIAVEGAKCRISASIGVTTTAIYDRPDAERMTADADAALYASKKGGRGRAMIWTSRGGPGAGQAPTGRVLAKPLPGAAPDRD